MLVPRSTVLLAEGCCVTLKDGRCFTAHACAHYIIRNTLEEGTVEHLGTMRIVGSEHLQEPRGFRLREHSGATKDTLRAIQSHL